MLKQLFFIFTAATTLGGIYIYHEFIKELKEESEAEEGKLKELEKLEEGNSSQDVQVSKQNGTTSQGSENESGVSENERSETGEGADSYVWKDHII